MLLPPKLKRHYVNNKDFFDAMVIYRENMKLNPETRIPDYVGYCVMKINEKLSTKPNFASYSYRDEMVADGVENCIAAINGFDPAKSSNPFSYFTQISWNAFIRRIAKEKKQSYIKHKNMQHLNIFDEEITVTSSNEASDTIIADFEKKLAKAKNNKVTGIEKFADEG